MALYEYACAACGTRTEKRMPMADVLQSIPCPKCKKTARKVIGGFALVGVADASVGDGPAPWDDDGGDGGLDAGAPSMDFGGGHGHSHGPGGHTH